MDEKKKLLIFEKGGLIFAFNFSSWQTLDNFTIPGAEEGKWKLILDTGDWRYSGFHEPDAAVKDGPLTITLYPRTASVFVKD